jgi:hypothetical protein
MAPNKSPKPTLENAVALRGPVSGSATWLKRYKSLVTYFTNLEQFESVDEE